MCIQVLLDIKAKVKEELFNGCRLAKMEGTPVGLSLKADGGDDEEQLADGLDENLVVLH